MVHAVLDRCGGDRVWDGGVVFDLCWFVGAFDLGCDVWVVEWLVCFGFEWVWVRVSGVDYCC